MICKYISSFPPQIRHFLLFVSSAVSVKAASFSAQCSSAFISRDGLARAETKMADEVQKCAVCGVENSKLQRCARCKTTCYCGRECQRSDWKSHKLKCKVKEISAEIIKFPWQKKAEKVGQDFQSLAQFICTTLVQYNFCVIDDFLAKEKAVGILNEVKELRSSGVFRQGKLHGGKTAADSAQKFVEPKLRGDKITWLEGNEAHLKQLTELIRYLDELVTFCSSQGLGGYHIGSRTKAMVAFYPGEGTGYIRHVDNPDGDGRCLTVLYYLNKDWKEADGGKLRIYRSDSFVDIKPELSRLLLFWSDARNPHEVLPSFSDRYAVTVWYFDSEQRRQAKMSHGVNLVEELDAEIALKEVQTKKIERDLAKLKLEAKSEELLKSMLSEEDLDAFAVFVQQQANPCEALAAVGIAPSIQDALMKLLAQRGKQ